MSSFRTKNMALTAKVEVTPGVDAVPTVGANAILMEQVDANPNFENIDTDEATGALDDRPSIPGGGYAPLNGTLHLKGSGAAGTAPEYSPLLIGCGMAETLLAADLDTTVTAGTENTISLASVAGAAIGMVLEITGGTGIGQRRVIAGIAALVVSVYPDFETEPDETSEVTVYASALYVPASSGLKTLTLYKYQHDSQGGDSVLTKILGAAGTGTFTFAPRDTGKFQVQMRGKLSAPVDIAHPGAVTLDAVRPQAVRGADIHLGGAVTRFNSLTLNMGGTVDQQDDPGAEFGYGEAGITRRRIEGRINPPLAQRSVRDAFASWLQGTPQSLWLNYGTAVGNRVSLYCPALVYTGEEVEDVRGYAASGLPFRAEGQDTGFYLCIW